MALAKSIVIILMLGSALCAEASHSKDNNTHSTVSSNNKFLDNRKEDLQAIAKSKLYETKNSTKLMSDGEDANNTQVNTINLQDTLVFLQDFASIDFGGKWKYDNIQDIHRINSNFEFNEGKARFKFQTSNFAGVINATFFEFTLVLYDGIYINENIELSSSFKISGGVTDGLTELNKLIKIETGKLFSRPVQSQIMCDMNLKLYKDEANGIKTALFTLTSSKDNFLNFSCEFSNPYSSIISGWRIFIYSTVLFGICLIFINELIIQTRKAEESQIFAERISLFTISWNTMWNIWLFNIHSTYALNDGHYYTLVLPSIMFFIICIIFEITLLHICWKARNSQLFLENPEEIRRQIILFYLKFYITYIIAISLSEVIFSNSFLLVFLNGLVWVPQIIENVKNRSKNVPTTFFCIALSFSQGFMPSYFLLFDSNIFEIRNSAFWGITLLSMHVISLLILQCQRWFGARFFIPKSLRMKSNYQYHDLFEDPEGDADKDCAICLNNLADDHGMNIDHRDDFSKRYMRTPCGHNFHPTCLRTWMNQKLECPSCRTQIPALDSDDEEED